MLLTARSRTGSRNL